MFYDEPHTYERVTTSQSKEVKRRQVKTGYIKVNEGNDDRL
jgi:hypothetical protein